MDPFKHTDPLVLQTARLADRTPFCPEDQVIAEYFDGAISGQDHQQLERHLADCRYCQARIGVLNRQQDNTPADRITGEVLARAKSLAKDTKPRKRWISPAWAATAAVLLGVYFVAMNQPVTDPEPRQLRNFEQPESRFEVSLHESGNVISPGFPIRWTELSEGSHYTVYILSDDGDVLWTEHLQGNEWTMQEKLQLDPDGNFFLRVEAELPNGSTVSSKHLAFRLKER